MSQNIAVFLDRDNTLNFDSGYLYNPDEVKLMNGVAKGLKRLKTEINVKLIVISNQSGVVRGYFQEKDVIAVNEKINSILMSEEGVEIEEFFYCIHHPHFSSLENSQCRKPSPQMVFEAAQKYNIDLGASYFVGDMVSDVQCGINAGTKTILLVYDERNSKINQLKKLNLSADFLANDFLSACDFIINDFKKGN